MGDDIEQETFYNDLQEFVDRKRIEYPNPVLMSRTVDLYKMYKSVQERGGYNTVTKENTWKFVFLDCTDAPSYSSNTGYYTRLSYERYSNVLVGFTMLNRSLLDFDRSRPSPFARVFKEDEEKMMKKKTSKPATVNANTGAMNGPTSPKSAISDGEEESEIDPQELEKILDFDYDGIAIIVDQPPETEEEREKWYEDCEEKLRLMQNQHRSLQKYLYRIDKKLGLKTRGSMASAQSIEHTATTSSSDLDKHQTAEETTTDAKETEDEIETNERKRRSVTLRVENNGYEETEDESESEIQMTRRKRRRR